MSYRSVGKVFLIKVTWILLLVNTVGTVGLSQDSFQQPAVLRAIAPVYPVVAASARVNAIVTIEVQVDVVGKVTSLRVIEGHKLLDKAAENAARSWEFAASKDEVARSARLTFIFILMPDSTSAEALASVFAPPYKIEVRRTIPKVVDSPNIDPHLGKRQKKRS